MFVKLTNGMECILASENSGANVLPRLLHYLHQKSLKNDKTNGEIDWPIWLFEISLYRSNFSVIVDFRDSLTIRCVESLHSSARQVHFSFQSTECAGLDVISQLLIWSCLCMALFQPIKHWFLIRNGHNCGETKTVELASCTPFPKWNISRIKFITKTVWEGTGIVYKWKNEKMPRLNRVSTTHNIIFEHPLGETT